MSLLEWSDKLDTGVDQMNDQHKHLLDLMNDLHQMAEDGAAFALTHAKLDELKDYTIKHFQEEEQYMESIGFPGLSSHKIIHKDLLERFTTHYQAFVGTQRFSDDFFSFLKLWLQSHIMGIDVKYGAHAKAA